MKDSSLKKVLVIGSGPIIIGQAAEFDYAGTQACRTLKKEGIKVILVNSNPATIMTDAAMADAIYIEPLTLEVIKRIIIKEKPDGLLSTMGGQTGLNLSMQLARTGFLKQHNVKLLGADPTAIDKAEDRQSFKDTMMSINQPVIPSKVVTTLKDALNFAEEIKYPVIVRPAFTLGGTGGGIANDSHQLEEIASNGLNLSPIHQILVEKSVWGWKEIEFEVIRDHNDNAIIVCSMENMDPVGVHTGDSIVVAPAITLADREYEMLRTAALNIVKALGINGGCNVQFALNPNSFEYAVIEVNPRVSRSSALASKATGYPIAKVATKLAIGYTLDEIKNDVTGTTYACFEPAIDYIVVKFPKWPFDKFVYAKKELGTQMKATGEVMAIANTFEQAVMKAVRGLEIGLDTLNMSKFQNRSNKDIIKRLFICDDERIYCIYEALKRGISIDTIHEITMIDKWFLHKIDHLAHTELELTNHRLNDELYLKAKRMGFLDKTIEKLTRSKIKKHLYPVYKMVDTCAGEFDAQTPYFYSSYWSQNDSTAFINKNKDKKRVIVLGSGPIRIGQGIEFDYASVHCVWALKRKGYEVVIVNNNPETVSTDFDTADRLYFEPLSPEDVMNIIHNEKPYGVVITFGGQTAIKLAKTLAANNVNILGTSSDAIDLAEDRKRFDKLLVKHKIAKPDGFTVLTKQEALDVAHKIGYPLLIRPSYVLGGQNMIIAWNDDDVKEYMDIILSHNITNPILIDKYLEGVELEIDAICDGHDILIPGIMEHIEKTGVHSGDSIAVYPSFNISKEMVKKIVDTSKTLAVALGTVGLINIQYLIYNNELYVIEANPRSSRTIPYLSKVTGVPIIDLATNCLLGEKLKDMGYGTGLYQQSNYVTVKVPVFSFQKLTNVDTQLGPEMKSTGEVLGIAKTLEESVYKGLIAAGYQVKKGGEVFITVKDRDKQDAVEIAKRFYQFGFKLYATAGTAAEIEKHGIPVERVNRIYQSDTNNCFTLIESGKITYVISTSSKGRDPERDSVRMRRKAVERNVPCFTSLDTVYALLDCIEGEFNEQNIELVDINAVFKK